MTVAVSCTLPDGVILGVDSAVSVPSPDGNGIVKVYENAEKIFQLGNMPVGIAIYGLGALGSRSIGSYIREFEVKNHKMLAKNNHLKDVVEAFRKFFMDSYRDTIVKSIELDGIKFEEILAEQRPTLGLIIGGFSNGAYLPEVWQLEIPHHSEPNSGILLRSQGNFGTNWFAMCEPIRRYIKGFEPTLLNEILDYITSLREDQFSPEESQYITEIIQKHEYQIPYHAMSIKEGTDHTRFLVELVINHHRFSIGAPVVGGKARIGKVSYKGERFEILDV